MTYKTILLCAVIGASMQSAWGMDKELAQETAQREIDMIHGGWLLNTTSKDDAFNASEFRKADVIIEELDLLESGSAVLKNPDDLALKISTVLETYRKNKTNNGNDNNKN